MKKIEWIYGIILCILVFLIYGQTFNDDFNIDDNLVCAGLGMVERGVEGIPEILTTNYINKEGRRYLFRPLARVTFAIENQFLSAPPQASHIINVLLYLFTCFLIYFGIRQLVAEKYHLYVFLGVLTFAVHPLHTEVVCSLKNREEILSLLFSMLSLLAFVRFIKKSNYLFLFLAFIAFSFAVLAKISSIPFLLLIGLFCIYLKEKWWDNKYLAVGVTSIVPIVLYFIYMAYILPGQGRMPGVSAEGLSFQEKNAYSYSENPLDVNGTPSKRLGTAGEVLVQYTLKNIFPTKLVAYYGFDTIPISPITHPRALLSILLHLGFLVVGLFLFYKRSLIGMGIIFYLGCLFPYLNIIAPMPGIFAERIAYFPSLGYCILLIGVLIWIVEKRPNWNKIVIGMAAVYIGLFAYKSFDRAGDWKDKITLLEADTKKEKRSAYLYSMLGDVYYGKVVYEQQKEARYIDKSVQNFEKSLKIFNGAITPYYKIAYLKSKYQNNLKGAIPYYQEALKRNNTYEDAHFNLAATYHLLGDRENAIKHYQETLKLNPQRQKAVNNLNLLQNP